MASGDVLVSCLGCGAVFCLGEMYGVGDDDDSRELPAGADLPGDQRPCAACQENNGYRILIGPLHVPRPEPEIPPAPPAAAAPHLENEHWTIPERETNFRIEVLDSEGVRIALVTGVNRAENAPLIRTAPELLAGLLKFQAALRGFFINHDPRNAPYTEISKALEFADLAVAKARQVWP